MFQEVRELKDLVKTVESGVRDKVAKEDLSTQTDLEHQDQKEKGEAIELISPSPTGVIDLAGVKLGCVVDTGAEASIIPSDVFHTMLADAVGPIGKLTSSIKIIGVSGVEVPVEGYIEVPVNYKGFSARVGFLITPREMVGGKRQEEFPVLLGCNALKSLAGGRGESTGFSISLGHHEVPIEVDRSVQQRQTLVTIAQMEEVEAGTAKVITCKLSPGGDVDNKPWLVGTEGKFPDLRVLEGCVVPTSSEVKLLVINCSEQSVVIPAGTTISSAYELRQKEEVLIQTKEDVWEVDVVEVMQVDMCRQSDDDGTTPTKEEKNREPPFERDKSQVSVQMGDGSTILLPPGVTLPQLDIEHQRRIAKMFEDNSEAFSQGEFDLGLCDVIPHKIKVTSDSPIRQPYRRIPPTQMEDVKQLLQDMLEKKIIRRSASPYASPVVLVKKKTGAFRVCIDYRKLNAITVKDSFPLPRIEESLEAMHGANFFSSMDLSHGYFQIAMDPGSIQPTAFRVPWGLFEFLRLPQGLCNSPSTFQRIMEMILGDLNLTQIILYLDDILVFSKDFDEHLCRLERVLQRLVNHGLKLKGEKCNFFQSKVNHLGHVVSAEGVSVNPAKIEKIMKWPTPTTSIELSSFLGLASYYRRFVPGFAKIAAPLHSLKAKGGTAGKKDLTNTRITWNDEAEKSFTSLKELLSTAPVLIYPNFEKEFVLEIDASLKGLGACLMQKDEKGYLHPVAYASRGLRGAEKNYSDFSSFKIELLGLKWAVADKFREYLIGTKCTVFTDNNPLAHLQTAKLGATEQRWVAQLAPFNLEIKYKPGKTNCCADALSRCPSNEEEETNFKAMINSLTASSSVPVALTSQVQSNPIPDTDFSPCLFPSFTQEQLGKMRKDDAVLSEVWKFWKSSQRPEDKMEISSSELRSWLRESNKFVERNGVLYRKVPDVCSSEVLQFLVPACLRGQLMEISHDQWGHQGVNRTFSILRQKCFWPGLHKDVKDYISQCLTCCTTKDQTPRIRTPQRHLLAFRPLELVAIDFLKLDKGKGGYEDVLVVTDVFTKYSQAIPCRNQTAPVVVKALRDHWISHYGAPLRIHSDQGRNFESLLIKELCKLYGITQSHTTPYHPQGNGQTERFNKTLCSMIRSVDPKERRKWPELLFHLLFLYNATPHTVTGISPFRLMFGREPYTVLDQLLFNAKEDWNEDFIVYQAKALEVAHRIAQKKMTAAMRTRKERHDTKPMSSVLPVGTRVLLKKCAFTGRHKLEDKYYREAFVVVWRNREDDVYTIRPVMGGPTQTVNRKLLLEDPRADCQTDESEQIECREDNASDEEIEGIDREEDVSSFSTPPYWLFGGNDIQNLPPENPPGEPPDHPPPRRSARHNKGHHSNPAHLPRSAIPR
ncbi:hypothetical protein HOLleu_40281 [Holothuria leucospilota]|uniref:Endonuclease n=1 Tax=Holothuria leucospilota TaxID=206669 RepID=A0A9Q0YI22_HOLLE|nr:hypothetical protein HOLleu_40281 [Holothuria leucospilota]